ncbi:Myb-like DNA-binding domain containing protein [Tritrichomonas foetus]|uniref:Myb-like DNA-binding domain containing protein n=1 Tax=Tritrichomonas foetus TaxID=1144522 RepID=A0A1J4JG87_9EUKA|nr:Myb-like DNA-binding domain containing protein [Tritrichomonas foetus]|eukprot:OHS98154.1 Myb-like DNA-binding domain containing protein [Tritrichomonas foetus]
MSSFHDIIMSMKDRVRRPSTCRPHPKIKFTKDEDERLRSIVTQLGEQDWDTIADHMPGRNQRQCRERWLNYLSPNVNREPWSAEEDALLIEKHNELGSRWVRIAKYFVGRSDTSVKNRWMVLQRKILLEGEESLSNTFDMTGQNHTQKVCNSSFASTKTSPQQKNRIKKSLQPPINDVIIPSMQPLRQPQQMQICAQFPNMSNNAYYPSQIQNPIPYQAPMLVRQVQRPIFQQPPLPPNTNVSLQMSDVSMNDSQIQQRSKQQPPAQVPESNFDVETAQLEKQSEAPVKKESNEIDENDEVDFWNEIFNSNEFQSTADSFQWY